MSSKPNKVNTFVHLTLFVSTDHLFLNFLYKSDLWFMREPKII